MKTFILVIALLTNGGELKMDATIVPSCDGKKEFVEMMEARVKAGDIKDWNAVCITSGDKEHGI